jgi:hypothetical protein|tara:strand:+ start:453 stop:584 length:132 start_codon:yes stop_codon:yes gene_type:complete
MGISGYQRGWVSLICEEIWKTFFEENPPKVNLEGFGKIRIFVL